MDSFTYLAPRSLGEAFTALGNGKRSLLLAGGTDVIVQLREGRRHCDQLIDLKHIPELMAYRITDDGALEVGASVPLARIYEDAEIQRRFPALVDCASIIGGVAIQSRATLGGNLCNASPAADSSPALIALGARVVIASSAGLREIPVEELFAGPGSNITAARVALGAVAATPILAPAAAAALVGAQATPETFAAAGEAAAAAASPIDDMRGGIAQRRHLAKILTIRALEGALKRIRETR
ncbi:MAG: FAD binding domain-containing protein [Dehalococcoidia bacterium]|nr:FAD binding domain-containing protein [Dehalococcoidia bacterium]